MGWFLNLVKPKIQSNNESNIPDNLWVQCQHCHEMIFATEWETAFCVCPKCNFHARLPAGKRIALLADTKKMIDLPKIKDDPIGFKDTVVYKDRLRDARKKTGLEDAVLAAEITMDGNKAIVFVMDFNFIAATMGSVVGEKITRTIERATKNRWPVIIVSASGGARMYEGMLSLMQMAKTSGALARHAEAKLPYISVLTNPTTAGVMASYASLGDIIMAEPKCMIGFAGPRVIRETTHQELPKGFQTAEFLQDHGLVDMIVARQRLRDTLSQLLNFFGRKK